MTHTHTQRQRKKESNKEGEGERERETEETETVWPLSACEHTLCLSVAYRLLAGGWQTLNRKAVHSELDIPCIQNGSFRKLEVPYFGVLIIRILLFRVLYY